MINIIRAIFGLTIFLEEIEELAYSRDKIKELEIENNLLIEKVDDLEGDKLIINLEKAELIGESKKLIDNNKKLRHQISILNKRLKEKDIALESRAGQSCCSCDLCGVTPNLLTIDDMIEPYMKHFSAPVDLSDDIAVYVPDLVGGKVIKQEANRCIKINKEGDIEEGYTRKRCDKGFNYKLIREK